MKIGGMQAVAKAQRETWRQRERKTILDDGGPISRPLAEWMGPDYYHRDGAEQGLYGSVGRIHARLLQCIQATVAFWLASHAWRVWVAWGGGFPLRWTEKLSGRGRAGRPRAERVDCASASPWRLLTDTVAAWHNCRANERMNRGRPGVQRLPFSNSHSGTGPRIQAD